MQVIIQSHAWDQCLLSTGSEKKSNFLKMPKLMTLDYIDLHPEICIIMTFWSNFSEKNSKFVITVLKVCAHTRPVCVSSHAPPLHILYYFIRCYAFISTKDFETSIEQEFITSLPLLARDIMD